LINEQVAALTGQRHLGDYSSDDAQYRALMGAGATFAAAHQLRPGVALSAAQMAALTADIVWLVEQNITLADGSTTRALVPQVYVMVRPGDLHDSGALIAARDISLNLSGDLHNAGSIAGRRLTQISAENIHNLGGQIAGETTVLGARTDLNNTGGSLSAQNALVLSAGRDLNLQTTTQSTATLAGPNRFTRTSVDRVAGLYLSQSDGMLLASAGQDVNLNAALVQSAGGVRIQAGQNLRLAVVGTESSDSALWNANNVLRSQQSTEVGTRIDSGGATHLLAGQDLDTRAAQVQAQAALVLQAGRDVNLLAGQSNQSVAEAHQSKSRGFLSSSTSTTRSSASHSEAVASRLGGQQVLIQSGLLAPAANSTSDERAPVHAANTPAQQARGDINIAGSQVVGDQGTTLLAGRDVNITSQETRHSSSQFEETKKSGLFSSGGLSITLGTQQNSREQQSSSVGAQASTVGAITGDVNIQAGRHYRQQGSDVLAPEGDVQVQAQDIAVLEARTTHSEQTQQKSKQSGLSVAVTAPVISSVQDLARTARALGKTDDTRMQALGAATLALQGRQAAKELADVGQALSQGKSPAEAANVGVSLSLGSSHSQSSQQTEQNAAQGSNIRAGGQVALNATGAGADSNLLVRGSRVQAGDTVSLSADNQITLAAAQNTTQLQRSERSSSASIGLG
uniref:hemagglutinin repeat-containing protein n=1 Tax=Hydrogenophaga sp. TaxID=1904254 RepID=UPI0035643F44